MIHQMWRCGPSTSRKPTSRCTWAESRIPPQSPDAQHGQHKCLSLLYLRFQLNRKSNISSHRVFLVEETPMTHVDHQRPLTTGTTAALKHIWGDFKQIPMKKKKSCTQKNLDLIGCGQQWWLGRWKYDSGQQWWPHPIKSCTRIVTIKTALFQWQMPLASFWMFLNFFFYCEQKKRKCLIFSD